MTLFIEIYLWLTIHFALFLNKSSKIISRIISACRVIRGVEVNEVNRNLAVRRTNLLSQSRPHYTIIFNCVINYLITHWRIIPLTSPISTIKLKLVHILFNIGSYTNMPLVVIFNRPMKTLL